MRTRPLAALARGEHVTVRRHGCELLADTTADGRIASVSCLSCIDGSAPQARSSACVSPQLPEGMGASVPCRRGRLARALASKLLLVMSDTGLGEDLLYGAAASLARSPEPNARVEVARDPACPPQILGQLAQDWWWEVRAAVALHPSCPGPSERRLAGDPSIWVRRALAESPTASEAVLTLLSNDEDAGVRDAVAEHPHVPSALLSNLARDKVWEIRRSIAKREDAPYEALLLLAEDTEHWVRFFVACNRRTPYEVRARLEHDPHPAVGAVARRSGRNGR